MILNKKEYPSGIFEEQYIEEFCNLKIYPLVNKLETEAGLLSDIAFGYFNEGFTPYYDIVGPETEDILFLKDQLYIFPIAFKNNKCTISYYHDTIIPVDCTSAVVIAPDNDYLKHKYKIPFGNKFIYLNDSDF